MPATCRANLFKSMARVSMVHIPYNGASPAQLSVLSGQTDLIFDNLASASANIQAGKLKAFAVTTPARAAAFPELPTIAEAGKGLGLEGFDISTWFGVLAPAGTPREIVDRLNHDIVAIPQDRRHESPPGPASAPNPAPTTPEQFAALDPARTEEVRAGGEGARGRRWIEGRTNSGRAPAP